MTSSTVLDSKQIPLDVKSGLLSPEVFTLLESQDIQTAEGIKQLIQENLASTKESWLVHSLIDYYFLTQSSSVVDILCTVKDPHDKFLLEKLNDGIKSQERQIHALQIMLHIVCKQPMWLDKVVTCGVIKTIIKTLKTDASVPVLTTSVTIVTILLPSVPTLVGNYLPDLFEIFNRLASYSIKKPAGNTPDIFHLHLQIAVYGLFHRLYGMFPYNLLSYFRQYFHKKEHTQVFEEVIKHMLERVRLHPKLVTVQDKEHEISTQMWRQLESHDIVVECNKMSLDPVEGIWEELQCPIVAARYITDKSTKQTTITKSQLYKSVLAPSSSSQQDSNQSGVGTFWSPSEVIGLSTPPPTPTVTDTPINTQANVVTPSVMVGTNITPLVITPSDTPVIHEDQDKGRSGSRGVGRLSMDSNKRLSCEISQPVPLLTPSSHIPSIPPSPLKAEFTNTPPLGVKTLPVINAARELQFDDDQSDDKNLGHGTRVDQSDDKNLSHMTRVDQSDDKNLSHVTRVDQLKTVTKTNEPSSSNVENSGQTSDKEFSRSGSISGFESSLNDCTDSKVPVKSDKVSVDTISQVIEGLERQTSQSDESDDEEVSELTSQSRSASGQHMALTSESVKKFMKSVNRIRFNSLTATNTVESDQPKFRYKRSRSCPQFPKIETMREEEDEMLSRSVSACCDDSNQDMEIEETNFSSADRDASTLNTVSKPETTTQDGSFDTSRSTTAATLTVNTKTETTVKITTTQTTEKMVSQCPVSTCDSNDSTTDLTHVMRQLLNIPSTNVCLKCQGHTNDSQIGTARSFFSTFSPPELLDRHISLGRDIHAKELSKLPIPSNQDVNWTHFGGVPPADEISILRGQLMLLHNQIMYERHKRDQHAKRNRRLLRKIAHTKTLEEQNHSLTEVVKRLETDISNLKDSLRLLESKNRKLQETQDNEEYRKLVQLKTCLQENEDLKNDGKELNILLNKQKEEKVELTKKLNCVEAKLLNKEKEVETMLEVAAANTKMKEQIIQLQKELLLMGELQQKCNDKLQTMKVSRAYKLEHDSIVSSLEKQLQDVRQDRTNKTTLIDSYQQQLKEQQDILTNKELALTDIKSTMEKIKTSHYDEIKSVQDKHLAALRVNQTLEAHILQLQMELEEEKSKHFKGGLRTSVSTDISSTDVDTTQEFRERTNSDPTQKSPVRRKLTRMASLPTSSQHTDSLSQRLYVQPGSSLKEDDFDLLPSHDDD
ncbi:hamartin [Mactra antiquata]